MPAGDSWKTTSGLLEEYEMTLGEVWFGKDPQYNEGKTTLFIVRGDAELDGETLEEEKRNFYSLGDGWEPDDGGDSAVHGSGKTQFNQNSAFGRFINAVVDLGDEVIDILRSRGETYEADTWRGLRFRFERKDFEFTDRETKEKRIFSVELPAEFLGSDDEEEAPKPKRGRKPAAEAETAAPAAGSRRRKKAEEPEEEPEPEAKPARGGRRKKAADDDGLRDEVIQYAAEWEDHADFMETVLDPKEFARAKEVQANEEMLNDILDAAGSIWTASRAVEPA